MMDYEWGDSLNHDWKKMIYFLNMWYCSKCGLKRSFLITESYTDTDSWMDSNNALGKLTCTQIIMRRALA